MSLIGDVLVREQPPGGVIMYNLVNSTTNTSNPAEINARYKFVGATKADVVTPTLRPNPLLTEENTTALARACAAMAQALETSYMLGRHDLCIKLQLCDIMGAFHSALGKTAAQQLLPEMRLGTVLAPQNLVGDLTKISPARNVCKVFDYSSDFTCLLYYTWWRTDSMDPQVHGQWLTDFSELTVPASYVVSSLSNAILLARKGVPYYPAIYYGLLLGRASTDISDETANQHIAGLLSAFTAACLTYGPEGKNGISNWRNNNVYKARRLFGGTPDRQASRFEADALGKRWYPGCAAYLDATAGHRRDTSHAAIFQWVIMVDPEEVAARLTNQGAGDGAGVGGEQCAVPAINTPKLLDYTPSSCVSVQLRQTRLPMLPETAGWYGFTSTPFGIPHLQGRGRHGVPVVLLPGSTECYRFLCGLYGKKPYDNITPLCKNDSILFAALFHPQAFLGLLSASGTCSELARHYKLWCAADTEYTEFGPMYKRYTMFTHLGTASITDFVANMAHSDAPELLVNVYMAPIGSMSVNQPNG